MQALIKELQNLTPGVSYQAGEAYFWSPKHQVVTYRVNEDRPEAEWALLHEAAHAALKHHDYHSDLELLLLEVAAWAKAKELAAELGITIDEEHVQDCLDTYRDWLHQRSTCPRCSVVCLQISVSEYACHNCHARWHVSASRFCRPYRLSKGSDHIKSRPEVIHPDFA